MALSIDPACVLVPSRDPACVVVARGRSFRAEGVSAYFWVFVWFGLLVFQLTYAKHLVTGIGLKVRTLPKRCAAPLPRCPSAVRPRCQAPCRSLPSSALTLAKRRAAPLPKRRACGAPLTRSSHTERWRTTSATAATATLSADPHPNPHPVILTAAPFSLILTLTP